jgi:uroporphyrinogen-III decarboxylase
MTPKERFTAALGMRPVDRIPVMYQHLGGAYHLQEITGTTISDGLRDVEAHKRLCLGALREYGFDNLMVGWGDILGEAEALGIEVTYGDPTVYPQGNGLGPERIADLEPVDPWQGSIWSVQLRAAKELAEEVGEDALVIASMNDPFLVASTVRGFEGLLVDQIADPSSAHRLLVTVLGTLKEGARIMREECGVEVVFLGDGIAEAAQNDLSSSLSFDIPYTAELVRHMHHLGLKVLLSNCALAGYTEEQARICSPDAMHIAVEALAYSRTRELLRDQKCLIAGISTMKKILPLAPDEVEMEVKKAINAFGPGPGLIMASAGEMPLETPPENIMAFANATR